jgi:hypothetical protein
MTPVVESLEGATCHVHGQEATAVCTRCGSFMCVQCPGERLCASCASLIGGNMTGSLRAPAVALSVVGAWSFLFQLLKIVGRDLPFGLHYNLTICGFDCLGPVSSLLTLVGGIQMARWRSYGLAVAGSVLAAIPFCNMCCGVSTGVGIWALLVLNRPEVKAGFKARASVDASSRV